MTLIDLIHSSHLLNTTQTQILNLCPLRQVSLEYLEIDEMSSKKLSPSLALDLGEAVDSTKSATLISKLAPLRSTGATVADFQDALFGGNAQLGRRYFMTSSAAECVRWRAHVWYVSVSLFGLLCSKIPVERAGQREEGRMRGQGR